MNNVPRFWMWDKFLTPENCEVIIKDYYQEEIENTGEVGIEVGSIVPKIRKTNVCWVPKTESISLLLFSKALIANYKAGWGFDVEDYEVAQLGKYQEGGHYDWHTDETFYHRSRGYHRKVSAVLFLSDPSTYTGGDFLFNTSQGEEKVEAGIGTIICFPAEVPHKVTPVTEGVRHSLVLWSYGPLMR